MRAAILRPIVAFGKKGRGVMRAGAIDATAAMLRPIVAFRTKGGAFIEENVSSCAEVNLCARSTSARVR
jgi:hypothetical protein